MQNEEIKQLNNFRPPQYVEPNINWEGVGIDASIVSLISDFDKNLII